MQKRSQRAVSVGDDPESSALLWNVVGAGQLTAAQKSAIVCFQLFFCAVVAPVTTGMAIEEVIEIQTIANQFAGSRAEDNPAQRKQWFPFGRF
jgi:hypothetical protein